MFHFLKWLIINKLKYKNETWKINQRFWKRIEILCDKLQFVGLTRMNINEKINEKINEIINV